MQGGDQSGKPGFVDVLEFVDEQDECGVLRTCGLPDRFQQRRQIRDEVAAIGETGFGRDIQTDVDFLVADLDRTNKSSQCVQRSAYSSVCRRPAAKAYESGMQRWDE